MIAPEFDTPAPPGRVPPKEEPTPPLIAPLLVSVVIVPELDTPRRRPRCRVGRSAVRRRDRAAVGQRRDRAGVGHPGAAGRLPVPATLAAVSAADRAAVGQRRDRRRSSTRQRRRAPSPPSAPLPPLIAPLLVSVVIVPALAAPAPPTPVGPKALPPLIAPPILLVSVAIVPAFGSPAPPNAAPERRPRRP